MDFPHILSYRMDVYEISKRLYMYIHVDLFSYYKNTYNVMFTVKSISNAHIKFNSIFCAGVFLYDDSYADDADIHANKSTRYIIPTNASKNNITIDKTPDTSDIRSIVCVFISFYIMSNYVLFYPTNIHIIHERNPYKIVKLY